MSHNVLRFRCEYVKKITVPDRNASHSDAGRPSNYRIGLKTTMGQTLTYNVCVIGMYV